MKINRTALAAAASVVAVVVAEGEIVRGQQPQGMIGALTLSGKLRRLAEDRDVKAVVLRVNSPGGDAFASEKIRRELQALRDRIGEVLGVEEMERLVAEGDAFDLDDAIRTVRGWLQEL